MVEELFLEGRGCQAPDTAPLTPPSLPGLLSSPLRGHHAQEHHRGHASLKAPQGAAQSVTGHEQHRDPLELWVPCPCPSYLSERGFREALGIQDPCWCP